MIILKKFTDIVSNLDALKLKDIELKIYENMDEDIFVLPKVIPFKGVNTDMLYIKNNRILFIKYMDTTEDVFEFLDEEILEIMSEECTLLSKKMEKYFPDIAYNYVFVMPYISQIDEKYGYDEFIENNVIFGEGVSNALDSDKPFVDYLSEENNEIKLSIFLMRICTEYFVIKNKNEANSKMKDFVFSNENLTYRLGLMERSQIVEVSSANYGNHAILGGAGTGKSTLMLGRVIKLSKIYPHHKFLVLTYTKQQYNRYKELFDILKVDMSNIEILTFSSFIFKLAKVNELVVDHNLLKTNYDKAFMNIMKQIENSIKNKKMFKGIFVDEGENFTEDEINLIYEFLYKTKNIFNVCVCKAYNINNSLNIYKCRIKTLKYEDELFLSKNYRQSFEITEFINSYCRNCNNLISTLRDNIVFKVFMETNSEWKTKKDVNIVKVEDLDDQINSVIWEVQHLVKDMGYKFEDIAIVYPYNKKKLKNGKVIYFQYMLRKSLEESGIEYMYAEDSITNITPKHGITISNIYSIKSLSYKAVIICELEMLYNQSILPTNQDYQVNDFVGDLNKVYTAMTRAEEYLSIVVSYSEDNSDIIKLLNKNDK